MVYMHHQNSQQHKLLDPTAVAENRIAGGMGEVTGAIPSPRPDYSNLILSFRVLRPVSFNPRHLIFTLTPIILVVIAIASYELKSSHTKLKRR